MQYWRCRTRAKRETTIAKRAKPRNPQTSAQKPSSMSCAPTGMGMAPAKRKKKKNTNNAKISVSFLPVSLQCAKEIR